jgi:glycerol-3-phosphate dehydrogenase subunit C
MNELIANKKVAYFSGCFANYYYPESGEATMAVMQKNGLEVVVPSQVCCALPMMAKGNVKDAMAYMQHNTASLYKLVSEGFAVVATCSSCGLFLKRDLPHFLHTPEAQTVSENVYHISEYLLKLHEIGELDTGFRRIEQTIFYHLPCHLRAQQIGNPSVTLLEMIPGTVVKKGSEICCGMSGAYGYEKKNYDLSQAIAAKLYQNMKDNPVDRFVTDCGGCRLQMQASGTDRPVDHPAILLREAYGV